MYYGLWLPFLQLSLVCTHARPFPPLLPLCLRTLMAAKFISPPQLLCLLFPSSQLLQVRSLSHLLKEPKFPAVYMREYIQLLERFEVVLSQTAQTLLIPSRLPKSKPPSVLLPPASPGCETQYSVHS